MSVPGLVLLLIVSLGRWVVRVSISGLVIDPMVTAIDSAMYCLLVVL